MRYFKIVGAKKNWLDGNLPFLIGYTPRELRQDIVLPLSNKKQFYYDFVSDEKIIVDEQVSKGFIYFGSGVIIVSLIGSLLIWKFDWFSLLIVVIGLLLVLYGITATHKEVILNRKEGLFSFPNWFYAKSFTIPFSETQAVWTSTGGASGALGMDLMVKHPKGPKGAEIGMHAKGFDENWSFMVWYMDKNRPLPPGDAFDPYRQKDFERRKAEGFPTPLYPSRVPIPEATPEQQLERNRHWRDEDYYGDSDSAWY